MKEMNVFNRLTVLVIFLMSCVIFSSAAWCAETADGFVSVPWSAGRSQVASIMKEKGFTLVTNKAKDLYDADIYRGTFADHPADLYFNYNGKDFFDSGWAFLLSVQGQGLDVAMSGYYSIMPLLKAKYGAFDKETVGEQFRLSAWNTVPTKKGVNSGVVEIKMQGGRIPDFSGKNSNLYGVWIQYRYRAMKDI
ncbi:MAG TPA: hypothetical protein VHO84_00145 [Syntrophorhabdaceae bacterium]|nr:hypothetical protein [Syntrophorhabdaceae bacterium]